VADDPQTLNLYSYGRNSPVVHADLNGHCLEDACIAEAALVFALYAYTASPAGQQVIRNGLNALANTPTVVRSWFSSNDEKTSPPPNTQTQTRGDSHTESSPADPNQKKSTPEEKEGAQDKKLTKGEIKNLKANTGQTAEEIKQETMGTQKVGKFDLYKNDQGEIVVKPKGSSGAGESTGYTTEHTAPPKPEPEPEPKPEPEKVEPKKPQD
jgi:Bacterial toxin 33